MRFAPIRRGQSKRPIHTRDFAPGAYSRGTLREQSSSVCTNDFMGILHPREQNFHPAKCSTIFNRLNIWEQTRGKLSELENVPSCVLTRAKRAWSMLQELNPLCIGLQGRFTRGFLLPEHAPGAKSLVCIGLSTFLRNCPFGAGSNSPVHTFSYFTMCPYPPNFTRF